MAGTKDDETIVEGDEEIGGELVTKSCHRDLLSFIGKFCLFASSPMFRQTRAMRSFFYLPSFSLIAGRYK
jgi:hypothetical protein